MRIDKSAVWQRIVAYQGATFRQIRGGEFTYMVIGNSLMLDRTDWQIPRSHIEQALGAWVSICW